MREHYIIFGAADKPDKCITALKRWHGLDGWALRVDEIDNDGRIDYGESAKDAALTGNYTTLVFCKRESAIAMLDAVDWMLQNWDYIDIEEVDDGEGAD